MPTSLEGVSSEARARGREFNGVSAEGVSSAAFLGPLGDPKTRRSSGHDLLAHGLMGFFSRLRYLLGVNENLCGRGFLKRFLCLNA